MICQEWNCAVSEIRGSNVVADAGNGHFGESQRFGLGLLAAGSLNDHVQQVAAQFLQRGDTAGLVARRGLPSRTSSPTSRRAASQRWTISNMRSCTSKAAALTALPDGAAHPEMCCG